MLTNMQSWDYLLGARLEGSSYLELPTILKWFTADIGYHNIHHLIRTDPQLSSRSLSPAKYSLTLAGKNTADGRYARLCQVYPVGCRNR